MQFGIPWEQVATQVVIWAVVGILGWVVGRLTGQALRDQTERDALYDGVRALLRSEIMRTHHQAMRNGFAGTVDKEVLQRSYDAYHALGGNGIATALYEEMMALPTKDVQDRKD